MESDDSVLLRRFAETGEEAAFGVLVRRHLRLVYGAALRQIGGDRQLAEDVSQAVFTLLAKKSKTLVNHPALAGWLFTTTRNCARDAARANERRKHWEEEAIIMRQTTPPSVEVVEPERLAPVVDAALHGLGRQDRDGIVLRFLEERSYQEIGRALGVSENAARMRVDRALEKLRATLRRRGITTTAAALGAALTNYGAVAVPGHLAAQVASGAVAFSAAGAGVGGAVTAFISIMNSTKTASVIVVLACGAALFQGRRASQAIRHGLDRDRELVALRSELANARDELVRSRERTEAADADMAQLLAAIEESRANGAAVDRQEIVSEKLTRAQVQKRFERAQELARAGRHSEAMNEYLWCFDRGMIGGFTFMVARNQLMEAMGELAKSHAPMREAILERRAAAERALFGDRMEMDQIADFAGLSRALGESRQMVDALKRLPPGDNRRQALLGHGAFEYLLEQRRYAEVVADRTFGEMSQTFDMMKAALRHDSTQEARDEYRKSLVATAAKNVEVLAGAGQLENARALATKVLAYDDSAETKAVVAERLARAGRPELMKP